MPAVRLAASFDRFSKSGDATPKESGLAWLSEGAGKTGDDDNSLDVEIVVPEQHATGFVEESFAGAKPATVARRRRRYRGQSSPSAIRRSGTAGTSCTSTPPRAGSRCQIRIRASSRATAAWICSVSVFAWPRMRE